MTALAKRNGRKRHGLTAAKAMRLHKNLLQFYREQAKDLPWRNTRDPWAIWVSEIMLQQTQVATVVPRYAEFMRRFPTVEAMAASSAAVVCEAWAGLGYYRRARSLHQAAVQVVHRHQSHVPNTVQELMALTGIGRYTAGAIASIAFGKAAAIVDGNVVRVLGRLFCVQQTLATSEGRDLFWSLAQSLVQAGAAKDAGHFNQSLMELGRTVCTPKAPSCLLCPVQKECGAYARGAQHLYPTPVVKPDKKALAVTFLWREDSLGLWLWQRPLKGLWAGLWEMPSAAGDSGPDDLAVMGLRAHTPIAQVTHLLTHRKVTAVVCRGDGRVSAWREAGAKPHKDALAAPLSSLARKAIVAARAAMV